ncbi:Mu-like prophage I protein [uncultured Desulfobacterium sp.]|uniref:Mu-like prophage I protein n=1 Tax=uncultured Desulfobacterium sp. TaxID=201089 RepID=A0A445MWC4_9BACT|nr:Mu-like prophage I protein [uncultured Desulfobacterium sp.]
MTPETERILKPTERSDSSYSAICNHQSSIPEGFAIAALNFEWQQAQDNAAPEWIPLLPEGEMIEGRDGRSWLNDRPQDILASFSRADKDVVIDWEHSTELKAPQGEPAPAAGWIRQMEIRNATPWGRVEWTPRGMDSVVNREYRYYSPVLLYEKQTGRIVAIRSLGLTNRPNLHLAALNHEQHFEEVKGMKQLLIKLGLPETATEAEAVNALGRLQADLATAQNNEQKLKGDLNVAVNQAQNPSLEKFVPRADYDAAMARAANAEKTLADQKKVDLETAINAEVDAAIKAGKITPASKEFYLATCRQDGGLERFKAFVGSAPVIGDPSKLEQIPSAENSIDDIQIGINRMMGIDGETYKKYGPKDNV